MNDEKLITKYDEDGMPIINKPSKEWWDANSLPWREIKTPKEPSEKLSERLGKIHILNISLASALEEEIKMAKSLEQEHDNLDKERWCAWGRVDELKKERDTLKEQNGYLKELGKQKDEWIEGNRNIALINIKRAESAEAEVKRLKGVNNEGITRFKTSDEPMPPSPIRPVKEIILESRMEKARELVEKWQQEMPIGVGVPTLSMCEVYFRCINDLLKALGEDDAYPPQP